MRTMGVLFLMMILLSALTGAAMADERVGGSSLDQGGTYCNAATVIPGATTHYIDDGYLDGDNDCSAPFAWPYNDVFYKYTPAQSGLYIFRLQLSAPSTDCAIRIMANSCCSGGTPMAAIIGPLVVADCDTGHTEYLRDTLTANVDYWFHLGDNSTAHHYSHYRFEMLKMECPQTDGNVLHQTCETALQIALNDSIMGDSASAENPDWFKFTLLDNSIVTISEFGRSFGHCTTGYYPLCFDNPLNAHFFVYCECPSSGGTPIAEAHGELCSTDAQSVLCLLGGGRTYYIKVQNYGGISWVGWDYILDLKAVTTTEPCVDLCSTGNPCPVGGETPIVTLTPDNPMFPDTQHVSMCAKLAFNMVTQIIVPVHNVSNYPTVTVSSGCDNCDTPCESGQPAELWIYNPNAWVYNDVQHQYTNTIQLDPAATGCCLCLHLDYVLPVELTSFTATAGDGQVTLNWATASETNNDHFDIMRDGSRVTMVQGAVNSAQQHNYHWTDNGLNNTQEYTYTLTSVDLSGVRHTLGTVTSRPVAGAAVISEYALRQNYPNPFNPTTQISFDLLEKGQVNLKVYNLMGQEVATLVNSSLGAGRHEVSFDATNLPSGIYVYRLAVNGFTADKKMLLMK
jgi:hypothetical protein